MKNKKVCKIILSVLLITVVSQIIRTIGALLTMQYYLEPRYFEVWSRLVMPVGGPPPMSFYFLAGLFGVIQYLIFTIIFCYFYPVLKKNAGRNQACIGLLYGLIVFLMTAVPMTFMLILMINLPISLILWWLIESLVIYLLAGLIVSALLKN